MSRSFWSISLSTLQPKFDSEITSITELERYLINATSEESSQYREETLNKPSCPFVPCVIGIGDGLRLCISPRMTTNTLCTIRN